MNRQYRVKHPFGATRIDTGHKVLFEPTDELWWDEEDDSSDPVIFTVYSKFEFKADDRVEFTQSIEPL